MIYVALDRDVLALNLSSEFLRGERRAILAVDRRPLDPTPGALNPSPLAARPVLKMELAIFEPGIHADTRHRNPTGRPRFSEEIIEDQDRNQPSVPNLLVPFVSRDLMEIAIPNVNAIRLRFRSSCSHKAEYGKEPYGRWSRTIWCSYYHLTLSVVLVQLLSLSIA